MRRRGSGDSLIAPRSSLVTKVLAFSGVVVIDAPSGYGKTTLLGQLVALDDRVAIVEDIDVWRELAEHASPASIIAVVDSAESRRELIAELCDSPVVRSLIVADRLVGRETRRLFSGFELLDLGASDLRVGRDELAMLAESFGFSNASTLGDAIAASLDGWPVAVSAAFAALASGPFLADSSSVHLAETLTSGPYMLELVEEHVCDLAPDVVDAISQLAHLGTFTYSCVNALIGTDGTVRLRRDGIPLLRGDDGWHRFPAPMTEVLRHRAALDPQVAGLLANVIISGGGPVKGVSLLLEAGLEREAAATLAELDSGRLDDADQQNLLGLFRLLDPFVGEYPRLHLRRARALHNLAEIDQQRECLLLAKGATSPGDGVHIEATLELLRLEGLSDPVATRLALEDFRESRPKLSPRQKVLLREIGAFLDAIHGDAEALARAAAELELVAKEWESLGDRARAAATLRLLTASAHSDLGHYDRAAKSIEHARQLSWNRLYDRARTTELACRVHALRADLSTFDRLVVEADGLAEAAALPWVEAYLTWARMWAASFRRDGEGTLTFAARAEHQLGRMLPHGTGTAFYAESAICLAQVGKLDEAFVALGKAQAQRALNPADVDLAEVVVWSRAGQAELVHRAAADLEASKALPPGRAWRVLLEQAIVDSAEEMTELAVSRRDEALAVADSFGLSELASACCPDGWLHGTNPTGATNKIHVQVLGNFEVRSPSRDVVSITEGHLATLLKLIAIHDGDVLVDVVLQSLWPDDDPVLSRRRLKNVVSRLRSLLGDDVVLRTANRLCFTDAVMIDLTEFQVAAKKALGGSADESIDDIVVALDLYQGELLPTDLYADWCFQDRETARARATALLDRAFLLSPSISPPATWLLDVLLRVDPRDDQRLLVVARRALDEQHIACARTALERAIAVAGDLEIDLDAEIQDIQYLIRPG